MNYKALYRVWRPQSFQDLVGQDHITKTLQNALVKEKFTHAYLFSGPRGTGKTSAAKIIAKAINCEKAPIKNPCNECPSCKGITDGTISDVIEIDAASNNGVDEIRDIRDKVKYAPSAVRYKVYIIDEVHMLSIGAFNALLKTLEEPPKHVIFILATTEPHKIPLTIISRCQRFDFQRISKHSMVERIKTIMNSSEIEIDDQAISYIVNAADGGMRDALSLLDQAISFSEGNVTADDVLAITGSISQQLMTQLVEDLWNKNTSNVIGYIDEMVQKGKEPDRVIEDLIYYFRDLLLYKADPSLVDRFERAIFNDYFLNLVGEISLSWIYEVLNQLNEAQQSIKWTNHQKVFLELSLIKISRLNQQEEGSSKQVEFLTKKIEQLEQVVKNLKEQGIQVQQTHQEQPRVKEKRAAKSSAGKSANIQLAKRMLHHASKQELQTFRQHWGDIKERLRKEKIAAHATLIDSEPVAASQDSFLIAFKYEIHSQMASEYRDIIEKISGECIGKPVSMIAIFKEDWNTIKDEFIKEQRQEGEPEKQEEADPIVEEAIKLFGTDLIEIKE